MKRTGRLHWRGARAGAGAALLLVFAQVFAQTAVPIDGLRLELLSPPIELAIAGRSAVLQVIRADEAPDEVAALAQAVWARASDEVRRDDDGAWRTVSRIRHPGIEALQLRASPNGGSEGYLIAWRLQDTGSSAVPTPGGRLSVAHRLLPSSALTVSDQLTGGAPAARTLVAWAPAAITAIDAAVAARAEALGLRRQIQGRSKAPDSQHERARFYSADGIELALTLHGEGTGTALVIHSTEASR
jgi:hypothetical protein